MHNPSLVAAWDKPLPHRGFAHSWINRQIPHDETVPTNHLSLPASLCPHLEMSLPIYAVE
jgi:hypothetical protein